MYYISQRAEQSRVSVSKSDVVLEIGGRARAGVELKRHLAPATVGAILRALPIGGNAHFMGDSIVYLESAVGAGAGRKRKGFSRGDVAFYPAGGSICFFVADDPVRQMSPIGRISHGIDEITLAGPGDTLLLRQAG